ncbi:BZ3500_MvSof-1268-A1-R1_Chr2-1g04147 [Microbotryum saponariae]|uniref:BZ3500_MvSof-1268-A1-R1_Chr2-1g04147 protein n=1 Tax=Microbotryum saponariae TaxID=289078 RepID=A0A2X0MGK9_9BASI|nr:BZ3500_MvSof-1268-A1-R1_Chr2-1g04147 [Microbotryum saponariae]SCZ91134.1 BZ3501_MvSof-1269-A2-R1_Chr2-1g03803 [Microbotryum saponariae]
MLAAIDACPTRRHSGSALLAAIGRWALLLLGLATIVSVTVVDAAVISNATSTTTNGTANTTDTANTTTTYQDLGFYNVTPGGGRWLTYAVDGTLLGEPINVVVSAHSDPLIMTVAGLNDWFLSIQYSTEFLNVSLGNKQKADLGDGNGRQNQSQLLRYNYFDTIYGTLQESVNGGSHVRIWNQNGSTADSGAWFVAASVEYPAAMGHLIKPNGYDLGRDEVVGNATMSNGTISPATNRTFSATSQLIQFLPANSSANINHDIETDGNVAILTVKVTSNGSVNASAKSGSTTSMLNIVPLQAKTLIFASTVLSIAFALLL